MKVEWLGKLKRGKLKRLFMDADVGVMEDTGLDRRRWRLNGFS